MPEQQFEPFDQRFEADGLDLVSSPDAGKPPRYPILVNTRQVRRGELRSRPALNALSTAPAGKTPWHSVRRLNDKPSGNYSLISGIGTELFSTPAAAAAGAPGNPISRDSGYSGNPLSLTPFKPENDVAEWMAVADAIRMRKIRLDGTVHQLGLPQPTRPPDVGLDWVWGLQRADLELGTGFAGWAVSNPGAIAANTLVRTNAQCTLIRDMWADGFDPTGALVAGWRSIEVAAGPPNGLANIGPGTVLTDGAANKLVVEEIHAPSPAATLVKSILFDDPALPAGPGYCTLVPVTAYSQFQQHAIVRTVGAATNFGVITSVIQGPDNTIAVRVYFPPTAGATLVGDAIDVRSTIYAYCTGFPFGAFTSSAVRYQNLVAGGTSTNYLLIKAALAVDASTYPISNKQVDISQDEMHISLQATDWTLVDEIKLQIDIDDGSFAQNFLSRTIRQSDLLALQTNALSAIDTRVIDTRNDQLDNVRRQQPPAGDRGGGGRGSRGDDAPIFRQRGGGPDSGSGPGVDDPGGSSSQGTTGTNQWSEIRFKLSDMFANRFGADISKGLQKIVALRLVVTRNTTAGNLDVSVGSWWIGGGSPPDIAKGAPYEYRIRYRSSLTGARSNWSPPSRSPVRPHRYSTYVQTHTSGGLGNPAAPTEADKIDIQRRGGTVSDWVAIGTVDKGGGDPFWIDVYDDAYALGVAEDPLALEGNVNDQPFTVQQPSFVDTATTVSGTLIRHVGAFAAYFSGGVSKLNQGTGITVGGTATLVYRLISADMLEVFDNVGSGNNIKLEMPSPELTGQPLPVVFGPVDGWFFACGDPKNPGRLYAFNHETLDSSPASFFADITDPGEPLQSGIAYLGRGYLWSSDSMFAMAVDPSLPDFPARLERLTASVGLFARYALTAGDAMYWLGKDGIYVSEGGSSHNITAGTLAPLFPSKQVEGSTTNTIQAPALTLANAAADGSALHQFRLSWTYDKTLWFDYPDGGGVRRSLGMQRAAGIGIDFSSGPVEQFGWWYDTYANGALFHYSGEGENVRQILCGGTSGTSKLYQMSASVNGDDGTPFSCQVRSFAYDPSYQGATKLFADALLDVDPGNASIAVKLYLDNWASNITPAASPVIGAARAQTILDLNAGRGQYAKNLAIDLVWTVSAAENPILYRWGGRLLARPDDSVQRSTDFTDCGYWGPKELRGCDIECSTSAYDGSGVAVAANKTLIFEYTKDDGTVASFSQAIVAREKSIVPVAFAAPVIGYEIRIRPSDSNTWKEYAVKQWHFDQLADLTPLITPWEGDKLEYLQGLELFADNGGAAVSLTVQKDFSAVGAVVPNVVHPGRGWKSYSFQTPFLAYLRRIVPSGPIRLMKWRWVAQPEAPLGDVWEAQEIELGDPFGFAQYAEIEYASVSALTLKLTIDQVLILSDSVTLASTGNVDPGIFKKVRVLLPAAKGRLAKIRLESSAQFRIREKGTGIYRKSFGNMEGFRFAPLIGAPHREQGALV